MARSNCWTLTAASHLPSHLTIPQLLTWLHTHTRDSCLNDRHNHAIDHNRRD